MKKHRILLLASFLWLTAASLIGQPTDYVGHWPFSGNANDAAGSSNGTVNGATLTSDRDGNANSAYSFDGVNDNIDIPVNAGLDLGTDDMSFSIWVKAPASQPNSWPGLITHGATSDSKPGYWLRIRGSDGYPSFGIGDGTSRQFGYGTSSVLDDQWHHVVFLFDRDNQAQIYVDGVNNTSGGGYDISSYASSNMDQADPLDVGGGSELEGVIDDIQIFDRLLTAQEISDIYNGSSATCNDGIQNGDETGVDCGGSCSPCPTCNDGIQNGDETGVDCGGSCSACPTCNDGIQNGDETGVDCGGSCSPCPTCNDGVQNGDETGVDCGGSCAPCDTTTAMGPDADWAFLSGDSLSDPIYHLGSVAIGTTDAGTHKLAVDGSFKAREVNVTQTDWADYVFEDDYFLLPLPRLRAYIEKHGHLPGIPTRSKVQEEGLNLGQINQKLLEKIEELTLYLLQQEDRIQELEDQLDRR